MIHKRNPAFLGFFTVAVMAFSIPSRAEDCSPIDLRSPGQSLDGVLPTSQGFGRSNLCGFYSASTMIDAWRGAGGSSKVSPIALGVEHAIERNIPVWFPIQHSTDPLSNAGGRAGSFVCRAIKGARGVGGCTDPSLRSDDFKTSAEWADKTVAIYKTLQAFGVKSKQKRAALLDSVTDEVMSAYLSLEPKPEPVAFSREKMRSLIQTYARKPYKTIHALFYSGCDANRIDLSDLPTCHIGTRIARVDLELERDHPLPVSFAYCARIHKDGPGILKGKLMPKNCGMHWSVVIGRKKIGDRCMYLIRNSYHPEKELHPAFIREGMDFWMDRETLRKASYVFEWLENRN